MEVRIPRQKFAYVSLDRDDLLYPGVEKLIEKSIELINKYGSTDIPDLVLKGQKCPKCGKEIIERIGISDKNNKPFHLIKCVDKNCDYFKFVDVEEFGYNSASTDSASLSIKQKSSENICTSTVGEQNDINKSDNSSVTLGQMALLNKKQKTIKRQ